MQPQPIVLGPSPYVNFQSNQHIIKSLMIGNQKVFYQPNQTIKQIKQQYQQVTSKPMNVQCSNVSIPLETKVQALEKVLEHAQKIQQVFTKLQEKGIQHQNIQIDNICQQRVNNVKKIDQNIIFQILPTASSLQKQQQADKAKKQQKEKLLQEQQLIVIKKNQQGLDELMQAMKKKRQQEEMERQERKKNQQWKKIIQRQEAEKRKQQQAQQKQRIDKKSQAKIKQQFSLFSFLSPQQTSQPKKPQQSKPSQQPRFIIKPTYDMNFKQFYHSNPWTCTINLTNLPQRPYYLITELQLTATMTPKDIVKELEVIAKTSLEVELSGAKGVRVPKGRFGWTLEKLGMVKEKELYVANVMKMCCFYEGAVMLQKPQSSSYHPTPIKQITQHPNPKSLQNFMLYDPDHHRTQIADILCFKRCEGVREVLVVKVKLEEELMELECGLYTLFYSEEFRWVSAAELWVECFEKGGKKEKRPRIWCLSKTYALALAQIYTIQHRQIHSLFPTTQPHPYFTLSTRLQTLILNHIIVHNTQSFPITLFTLTPNPTLTQSTIQTYPQLPLSAAFPNHQHYMLGGLQLNKHSTLGDYRIQAFKMVFVGEQGFEKYCKNQLIVTEYDGGWYRFGQVERDEWQERVGYWRDWCMGIHNKQILRLNDLNPYQTLPRLTNIVVGLRGNFQKLHYLKNIHPHFSLLQHQQHILRHITKKDTPFSFQKLVVAILGYCTTNNAYQVAHFIEGGYKEVGSGETLGKEQKKEANLLCILACMVEVFNSKQVKKFNGKLYFCEKKTDIAKRFAKTQSIIFKELKSGFKTQNEAIRHFQKYQKAGTIYQATVHSAVQTQGYSLDKQHDHILIPPFTCFHITSYNPKSLINRVCLQQIPMPQTNSDKKIFVVQDTDENVEEKYNVHFGKLRGKYPEIQIIHVKSKVMMNLIIKKFFWMFKLLGDKVHIFSVLKEIDKVQNKYNVEQCVDIAEIFINEGLSVEGFIYAKYNYPIQDKQKRESFMAARAQVQARFQSRKNWKVVNGVSFFQEILISLEISARQT